MSKRNGLIFSKHALYASASIVLAMCLSSSAWATCSYSGTGAMKTTTITGNVNIAYMGQGVNSVLWDSTLITSGPSKVSCGAADNKWTGYVTAMTPSGITGVYTTGIPGIGIKVLAADKVGAATSTVPWPATPYPFPAAIYTPDSVYGIQFITTGVLKPGTYSMASLPSPLAQIKYGVATTSQLSVTGLNVVVNANTCEAINQSITVNIPIADASKLVGGATGPETPFSIGLKCFGTPYVFMAFSDNTTPGNVSTTLTPSAGSTAKGVGLQILYKTKPIQYGPDTPSITSTNIIVLGYLQNAATVPLSVRYIGTGTITAGTLIGVATFIMSYP